MIKEPRPLRTRLPIFNRNSADKANNKIIAQCDNQHTHCAVKFAYEKTNRPQRTQCSDSRHLDPSNKYLRHEILPVRSCKQEAYIMPTTDYYMLLNRPIKQKQHIPKQICLEESYRVQPSENILEHDDHQSYQRFNGFMLPLQKSFLRKDPRQTNSSEPIQQKSPKLERTRVGPAAEQQLPLISRISVQSDQLFTLVNPLAMQLMNNALMFNPNQMNPPNTQYMSPQPAYNQPQAPTQQNARQVVVQAMSVSATPLISQNDKYSQSRMTSIGQNNQSTSAIQTPKLISKYDSNQRESVPFSRASTTYSISDISFLKK